MLHLTSEAKLCHWQPAEGSSSAQRVYVGKLSYPEFSRLIDLDCLHPIRILKASHGRNPSSQLCIGVTGMVCQGFA